MFNCPRCHHTLGRVLGRGANYWACSLCGGHAINLAVLRKVAVGPIINQIWQTAQKDALFSSLTCPACLKPMNVSRVFVQTEQLEVDACKRCQFLWFDGLELAKIPALPPPTTPPPKEIPQELREKMALLEVERIRKEAQLKEFTGADLEPNWQTVAGLIGLPVEVDPPMVKRNPLVTWGISLLIVIISVWGFIEGEEFIHALGFIPNDPLRNGGFTLLTSFFVHAGIFHLVSNLYFLLIFGDNVEDLIGRKRFVLVLLLSTLAGDVLHMMGDPRGDIPGVGASGGISGIITLYALAFPQAQIGILLRYFFIFHWIHFSARVAFAIWLAIQFFIAFSQLRGTGDISALAHLGGCSVGFFYWVFFLRNYKTSGDELR